MRERGLSLGGGLFYPSILQKVNYIDRLRQREGGAHDLTLGRGFSILGAMPCEVTLFCWSTQPPPPPPIPLQLSLPPLVLSIFVHLSSSS